MALMRRSKFLLEDWFSLNEKDANWAKKAARGMSSTGGGVGVFRYTFFSSEMIQGSWTKLTEDMVDGRGLC